MSSHRGSEKVLVANLVANLGSYGDRRGHGRLSNQQLADSIHRFPEFESLSLRQYFIASTRQGTSVRARGAHPGLEPSKMKSDGFDNFAEQCWTHEVRSRTQ
jgi:hypothetical protein